MFLSRHRKWWILITLCLMITLFNLDYTAINLALANIAITLQVSLSTIQWIITVYTMMSATLTLLGGHCSDIFGFKRLFIVSVIGFGAASLFAGLANSGSELIAARAFQGVAFAFFVPMGPALIFSTFEGKQRNSAMGIYIGAVALAQSIGPSLGGIIIHWFSWRYIFFLNVPLCVVSLLLGVWAIPSQERRKESIDVVGLILIAVSLLSIMYAFNEGHAWGIESVKFISLIVLGLLSLLGFVLVERKIKVPLADLSLFLKSFFTVPILIRSITAYGALAFLFVIGLLLQNILGFTSIAAGVMLLANTLFVGIFSVMGGYLSSRFSGRLLLLIGLGFSVLGFSLLLMINANVSLGFMLSAFALVGAGVGIVLPITLNLTLGVVPTRKRGQASGLLYTVVSIGVTLGPAVTGFIIGARGHAYLTNTLAKHNIALSPSAYHLATKVITGTDSVEHLKLVLSSKLQTLVIPLVQEIFISSFKVAMLVCLILSILATIMVFLMSGSKNIVE